MSKNARNYTLVTLSMLALVACGADGDVEEVESNTWDVRSTEVPEEGAAEGQPDGCEAMCNTLDAMGQLDDFGVCVDECSYIESAGIGIEACGQSDWRCLCLFVSCVEAV